MLDGFFSHTAWVLAIAGLMMLGVAASVYLGWRKEQTRRKGRR
jgi:hypothetical protein